MLVIVSSFFAHPHGGGFAKGHRVKKVIVPGFPDRIKPKRTSKSKMTCPGNSGGSSKVTA